MLGVLVVEKTSNERPLTDVMLPQCCPRRPVKPYASGVRAEAKGGLVVAQPPHARRRRSCAQLTALLVHAL